MAGKNYLLVKKEFYYADDVIKKARNIKELLCLEFPLASDEIRKLTYVIDVLNTTIAEMNVRVSDLEKNLVGK